MFLEPNDFLPIGFNAKAMPLLGARRHGRQIRERKTTAIWREQLKVTGLEFVSIRGHGHATGRCYQIGNSFGIFPYGGPASYKA